MFQVKTDRSEQQRERNGKRNNHCAAHVSQEKKENDNDQDDAFGQVMQDRMGGEWIKSLRSLTLFHVVVKPGSYGDDAAAGE